MSKSLSAEAYRADIDGLRALAICSVVAYHAGLPGFNGGFIGVDVFFVISGFLITGHLINEIRNTNRLSFSGFYSRRVRRLYPALLLVIVSVLIFWFTCFLGLVGETDSLVKSVRYSLFGFANVFFMKGSGGYFGQLSEEMPMLHFWSLGVEEQFYLIWPLFLFLCAKVLLPTGWKTVVSNSENDVNSTTRWIQKLIAVTLALSVASAYFAQHNLNVGNSTVSFYSVFSRFWELAAGSLLFFCGELKFAKAIPKVIAAPLAAVGVVAIVACTYCYTRSLLFPGLYAAIPVLGSALIIFSGCFYRRNFISRLLSSRPFVEIGLLSYGWYLWHWPILALARLWNLGEAPSWISRLSLILFSLLLAKLSLKFVENPVKAILGHCKPWKVILSAALASLLIYFATSEMRHFEDRKWGETLQLLHGQSLVPLCDAESHIADYKDCHVSFAVNKSPHKGLIIWGDSHAVADFPLVEDYARENALDAILYARNATPGLLRFDSKIPSMSEKSYSESVFQDIVKRIQAHPETTYSVILATRWMMYSGVKSISLHGLPGNTQTNYGSKNQLDALSDSLNLTIQELQRVGVGRILIILPYPEYKYEALRCIVRGKNSCDTSRSEMDSYRGDVVKLLRVAASRFKGVHVVDPVEFFCNERTCPLLISMEGKKFPVVFDDNHPAFSAIREFGRSIRFELDWLMDGKK